MYVIIHITDLAVDNSANEQASRYIQDRKDLRWQGSCLSCSWLYSQIFPSAFKGSWQD